MDQKIVDQEVVTSGVGIPQVKAVIAMILTIGNRAFFLVFVQSRRKVIKITFLLCKACSSAARL